MPTLKETIRPILLITIASAIIMFAIAPLDSSEWAEGIRSGFNAEEGEGVQGEDGPPGGIFRFVGPLIKITILMGIPGLITVGVRNLIRRLSNRSAAGAAPS